MADREDFPSRLHRMRSRRGVSRKTLSQLCGLSNNMVGCYESGANRPGADALESMAEFFGVSVDYLLCRTDDPRTL